MRPYEQGIEDLIERVIGIGDAFQCFPVPLITRRDQFRCKAVVNQRVHMVAMESVSDATPIVGVPIIGIEADCLIVVGYSAVQVARSFGGNIFAGKGSPSIVVSNSKVPRVLLPWRDDTARDDVAAAADFEVSVILLGTVCPITCQCSASKEERHREQ